MTTPPRMICLTGGGYQALAQLPIAYDKAVQLAYEKFSIPKDTHIARLSCKAANLGLIGEYMQNEDIYITDNDSYHYACAGKHVVLLDVVVVEKESGKAAGGGGSGGGNQGGGGDGGSKDSQGDAGGGNGKEGERRRPSPLSALILPGGGGKTAEVNMSVKTAAGKAIELKASLTGDLAKGPPAGEYLGTLSIKGNTFEQKFVGQQLGPSEVLTKFVVHNKHTARLLFRPRSIRPNIDLLYPEEKSLEVTLSLSDWQVLTSYPVSPLLSEDNRQKLRWFLRVKPGGIIEDLLSGTEASGLYFELLPSSKPRPAISPKEDDPLIPSWPDIRPQTAWCLAQSLFVPHMDRVLAVLGLPVDSRTAMITALLPGVSRHKNIAYRILSPSQISPTATLQIIPPPDLLLRIWVIFKGIPDGEMKEWADRGILQAEMGLDWRQTVGWDSRMSNESCFRVIEYGQMEVFD